MTYQLSPALFVENGAAVLGGRARAARRSSLEHELLARRSDPATTRCPLSLAA